MASNLKRDNLQRIEKLLKELSEAHGVSGREGNPRDIPKEEQKPNDNARIEIEMGSSRDISKEERNHRNVLDVLEEGLQHCKDEIEIKPDKLGNLIATINKNGSGPSVMPCAHMDEVGLSTSYIAEDGFLHFIDVGGWCEQTQTLLNQRVILHGDKGPLLGVIGSKPAHLLEKEERGVDQDNGHVHRYWSAQ